MMTDTRRVDAITEARNRVEPVEVCDFIRIPAWDVEGMVIGMRLATCGSDDAVEVLLETKPDDPNPRWYRVEPNEYEVL